MVKHAVQTMLFDFIRIHWRSLSKEEISHIKTSSLNQLKCANINDKKCTRICAEIGKSTILRSEYIISIFSDSRMATTVVRTDRILEHHNFVVH